MMDNSNEAIISFFAAACMEFVDYGACIEVSDIAQAVKGYKKICKQGTFC